MWWFYFTKAEPEPLIGLVAEETDTISIQMSLNQNEFDRNQNYLRHEFDHGKGDQAAIGPPKPSSTPFVDLLVVHGTISTYTSYESNKIRSYVPWNPGYQDTASAFNHNYVNNCQEK